MRILIVRLGAFGDIVHTLPLAADLTTGGHSVAWLCEDRWSALLENNPAIDRLHRLPRARWKRAASPRRQRWADARRLLRAIRAADYDVAIDAQGLAKSAFWCLVSGAARIGHRRPRAREGSWLVGGRRTSTRATHVIDQQRALALPVLGSPASGGWRFPLPAWCEQRNWARAWLRAHNLQAPWALNVGAGWPTKVWPPTRQQDLLSRLQEQGQETLVLWGSEAERQLAAELVSAVPAAVMAPATDLPHLGGLLAHCRVLVSGDTGPLHLAMALGTPTVGLFGPVPAERNGPRGRRHRCLQAPGQAWERKDVAKGGMEHISVDAVCAAIDEALA